MEISGRKLSRGIQKKAIIYLTNLLFLDMFYFSQVFPVMLPVTVIGCVSSLIHTCLCSVLLIP